MSGSQRPKRSTAQYSSSSRAEEQARPRRRALPPKAPLPSAQKKPLRAPSPDEISEEPEGLDIETMTTEEYFKELAEKYVAALTVEYFGDGMSRRGRICELDEDLEVSIKKRLDALEEFKQKVMSLV